MAPLLKKVIDNGDGTFSEVVVPFSAPVIVGSVTIANNGSLSGALDLAGAKVCGVITPSAWTSAAISFDVSADGTNYVPLYDRDGAEVALPAIVIATGAAHFYAIDPLNFLGVVKVKVRSGLNGATVNQGGARTLQLVFGY